MQPIVYTADQQANVTFSGPRPDFPVINNVTIPMTISSAGNYPVGVLTSNAFHDQVFIPIQ